MNRFNELVEEYMPEVYEKLKSKEWELSKEVMKLQDSLNLSDDKIAKELNIGIPEYLSYIYVDKSNKNVKDYKRIIKHLKSLDNKNKKK